MDFRAFVRGHDEDEVKRPFRQEDPRNKPIPLYDQQLQDVTKTTKGEKETEKAGRVFLARPEAATVEIQHDTPSPHHAQPFTHLQQATADKKVLSFLTDFTKYFEENNSSLVYFSQRNNSLMALTILVDSLLEDSTLYGFRTPLTAGYCEGMEGLRVAMREESIPRLTSGQANALLAVFVVFERSGSKERVAVEREERIWREMLEGTDFEPMRPIEEPSDETLYLRRYMSEAMAFLAHCEDKLAPSLVRCALTFDQRLQLLVVLVTKSVNVEGYKGKVRDINEMKSQLARQEADRKAVFGQGSIITGNLDAKSKRCPNKRAPVREAGSTQRAAKERSCRSEKPSPRNGSRGWWVSRGIAKSNVEHATGLQGKASELEGAQDRLRRANDEVTKLGNTIDGKDKALQKSNEKYAQLETRLGTLQVDFEYVESENARLALELKVVVEEREEPRECKRNSGNLPPPKLSEQMMQTCIDSATEKQLGELLEANNRLRVEQKAAGVKVEAKERQSRVCARRRSC